MSDRTFQAPRGACTFALACAATLLSACSGHLYTVENATPDTTPSGLKYQGIPVVDSFPKLGHFGTHSR